MAVDQLLSQFKPARKMRRQCIKYAGNCSRSVQKINGRRKAPASSNSMYEERTEMVLVYVGISFLFPCIPANPCPVMRKEAVFTLLLNATLFKGMKCFLAQDPRYIRFSVFEDGTATHYNLRVSFLRLDPLRSSSLITHRYLTQRSRQSFSKR